MPPPRGSGPQDPPARELGPSLLAILNFLREAYADLSPEDSRRPGPGGGFSPVEQAWHLADLEREGFGKRIQRLQWESQPTLPDFDGARIARERNYRSLSLSAGLAAFAAARLANLSRLRSLDAEAWSRGGTQEGVGPISLRDIPKFMQEHDAAHMAEIRVWLEQRGQGQQPPGEI